MIKVVCTSIIDAPWTPSPLVSPVSSLHHHQFPQLTSLRKFLWTPLLMEAPYRVAQPWERNGLYFLPVCKRRSDSRNDGAVGGVFALRAPCAVLLL